jgi:hypothetical protein
MSRQLELFARRKEKVTLRPEKVTLRPEIRQEKVTLPPFDFAAAIALDPRAAPRPDVPVPEWLRLPGTDP